MQRRVMLVALFAMLVAGSCSRSNSQPTAKQIETVEHQTEQRIRTAPSIIQATIWLSTSLSDNTGHVILTGEKTVAIRADGSTVTTMSRHGSGSQQVSSTRHIELADGNVIEISDIARMFTSLHIPDGQRSLLVERLDPRSDCEMELGGRKDGDRTKNRERILGYEVIEFRIQDADRETEIWRAPALNCVGLRVNTKLFDPRKNVEVNEQEIATKIESGEPRSDAFSIPRGYLPAPFSVIAKKETGPSSGPNRVSFDHEDALYEQLKH